MTNRRTDYGGMCIDLVVVSLLTLVVTRLSLMDDLMWAKSIRFHCFFKEGSVSDKKTNI